MKPKFLNIGVPEIKEKILPLMNKRYKKYGSEEIINLISELETKTTERTIHIAEDEIIFYIKNGSTDQEILEGLNRSLQEEFLIAIEKRKKGKGYTPEVIDIFRQAHGDNLTAKNIPLHKGILKYPVSNYVMKEAKQFLSLYRAYDKKSMTEKIYIHIKDLSSKLYKLFAH